MVESFPHSCSLIKNCVLLVFTLHYTTLWLLIDPVELSLLVALDLLRLKPQGDLLLGAFDTVRAVADISADIDGIITSDGAWG